jgi:hypothetical protein
MYVKYNILLNIVRAFKLVFSKPVIVVIRIVKVQL